MRVRYRIVFLIGVLLHIPVTIKSGEKRIDELGFFVLSYTRTHTFSSFLFDRSTVLFSKQAQTTLLSNVSALG